MMVFAASAGSEEGFAAWLAWSSKHPAHDEATCRERWDHFHRSPPTEIGAGTLFYEANQHGWRDPRKDAPRDTFGDVSNSRRLAQVLIAEKIVHIDGRGWFQRDRSTFRLIPKAQIIRRAQRVADGLVRETAAAITGALDVDGRRDDAAAHDISTALRAIGFQPMRDELGIRGRGLKGIRIRVRDEEPFG